MKWVETTFPFTHPSFELEIEYKGQWSEVLGCGILKHEILKNGSFFFLIFSRNILNSIDYNFVIYFKPELVIISLGHLVWV